MLNESVCTEPSPEKVVTGRQPTWGSGESECGARAQEQEPVARTRRAMAPCHLRLNTGYQAIACLRSAFDMDRNQ